jgi:hypothetical protein
MLQEENKSVFDQLYNNKAAIEESFGGELSWQRMDINKASRIAYYVGGEYRDENGEEIHADMVAAMIRLVRALRSYINQLQV